MTPLYLVRHVDDQSRADGEIVRGLANALRRAATRAEHAPYLVESTRAPWVLARYVPTPHGPALVA